MALLQYAFSVHNFISQVGADAGFAAIIGLAVLILLYFAHARETANLREEAALLTQRLQQAEARVLALSQAQHAASPPLPAEEQAPAHVPLTPFAPAGMAAPPLAAATRVVPLAEPPPEAEAAQDTPEPVAAPVGAMAMAGVAAASAASTSPPVPAPAPAPALGGLPAPATSAGGNGTGQHSVEPPARAPAPAWPAQISASRGNPGAGRQLPPLGALPPPKNQKRRSRLGRGVAVALVALAAVAVAVVVFALTSVGSNKATPAASTTNAPVPGHDTTVSAFKPSAATVAVLNGTSTNQLAHRIGQKLAALGYRQGTIATAQNQTETKTVVAYVRGTTKRTTATNRTDAEHVAQALGLRRSAVQQVDQSTLQVACPTTTACTANVVVTVGADLATQ